MQSSGRETAGGRTVGVRLLEIAAWGAGIVLVAAFAGVRLDGMLGRRAALRDSESARTRTSGARISTPATAPGLADFRSPDTSLWSPERVRGFEESLSRDFTAPLAVLRVPKIGLEVPVLEGTDEPALNRGVGHIAHTPRPGEPGNVGLAGHRDGFFRGLKDVSEGDAIELETLAARQRYTIRRVSIVSPERVDVLAATDAPTLTLVTCYPFYYVGSAPQRYIVHATLDVPVGQAAEGRDRAP